MMVVVMMGWWVMVSEKKTKREKSWRWESRLFTGGHGLACCMEQLRGKWKARSSEQWT